VAGLVVDASTNQRIAGALVVLVKPGVRVRSLTRGNLAASIATAGESTSQGRFRSKVPVPQGQTYGLLVLARGYHPLAVDNAVQVLRGAPPVLNLGLIRLRPRGY
jgi:hypothetical protein